MEPASSGKLLGNEPVKPMSASELKLLESQITTLTSGNYNAVPLKLTGVDPLVMSTARYYERPKEEEKDPENRISF
jgi:hypothetical protein